MYYFKFASSPPRHPKMIWSFWFTEMQILKILCEFFQKKIFSQTTFEFDSKLQCEQWPRMKIWLNVLEWKILISHTHNSDAVTYYEPPSAGAKIPSGEITVRRRGPHKAQLRPMLGAAKHEMSFHLQRESISGVQPPEQSTRRRAIQKQRHQEEFIRAASAAHPLLISLRASVRVNLRNRRENKIKNKKSASARERSRFCGSHQYVACSCSIYLRTASAHRSSSQTASACKGGVRSVWRSMQSFTSAARSDLPCCSCPRIPPPPSYRSSALCQPCSGMYYWSCWNDGF